MPAPPIDDETLLNRLNILNKYNGNKPKACVELGISEITLRRSVRAAEDRGLSIAAINGGFEYPDLPDDGLPMDQLLDRLEESTELARAAHRAKQWFRVKVKVKGPIGLSFIGDPHIDDNGCNIKLLRHHAELHKGRDDLFAVNLGDTINNWDLGSRLVRLWAEQDTSAKTAWRLADWFMMHSGFNWLIWLLGNHDTWNAGAEVFKRMGTKPIYVDDWTAKFILVFPNGRELPIDASHDHKGHSMWNSMHAQMKAAQMGGQALLYAAGHRHHFGMHKEELEKTGKVVWSIRARGYKEADGYATRLGYAGQTHGAAITAIIDPDGPDTNFVHCYDDMDEAVDILNYKRRDL